MRTRAGAAHVAEDVESADLSGVAGTPTFFVTGGTTAPTTSPACPLPCATPASGPWQGPSCRRRHEVDGPLTGASEMTISRDLGALAAQGVLKRYHDLKG